ncbi:MAG: phage tail tape measure protein, partial [Bacteroidales bacterium]|nr:phage tail tape measure protein [Bacteroidales bacterium]
YRKMGSQRPELLRDKEALADVTQNAIVLSEAAKIKLEPAVSALATTMNQFNARAIDSKAIINTLAAGSKLGAADIEYLNQAIEKSGTSMNLMGMSIEDNVALIEAVAPKYAEASQAGNSLDKVLLRMKEDQIGYNDGVFDMNRALDELRIRFQNGETATKLFGVRHAKMVEVLVQAQSEYNRFKKGVTDTNIATEQAIKNTNNNATALEQARNKVKLMYIEIGEKLAPALVKSTNGWNYMLKALMALPEFLKKNQSLFILLVGAIIAKNTALIKLIATSLTEKAIMIKGLVVRRAEWVLRNAQSRIMKTQILLTGKVTMAQKRAIVTTRTLNTAMKLNPIGALIMAITALVAAYKYYETHNKTAIGLEERKAQAIEDTAAANETLKETYSLIREQIGGLNSLSIQEKKDLQEKITKTIALAEAELLLAKAKRQGIFDESSQVKWYQAMLTFNKEKLIERGIKNATGAVQDFDDQIEKLTDRLAGLKRQNIDLSEILNAESIGDKIGTETLTAMEEKLNKYNLALRNAKVGSEDYLRIQQKINTLQKQMADARGVNVSTESEQNKIEMAEKLQEIYRKIREGIVDTDEDMDSLMEKHEKEMLDSIEDFDGGDPRKSNYMYWLESTYEGQKELLAQNLRDGVIAHQEYADKIKAIDQEMNDNKLHSYEDYANGVLSLAGSLYDFYDARKQRELTLAGDNDKAKERIEKKYAKRQKAIATLETIIQGVIEVARINSNTAVNADLTQTLRILLTGAAVARTAANVALIHANQYSEGKYDVFGNQDGQKYSSTFVGPIKTGYYPKPSLGLFSEKDPEIVIDGDTTRNIMTNFPEILSAIQQARVNQFAGGLYPSAGGSSDLNQVTQQLLIANMKMMGQVIHSHQTPSNVSFQTLREANSKYDEIQSRVSIG